MPLRRFALLPLLLLSGTAFAQGQAEQAEAGQLQAPQAEAGRGGLAQDASAVPPLPDAAAAPIASPSAFADTLHLSDAEKNELLSHNTEDSVDAARAGRDPTQAAAPDRKIHGEVGMMIGSNGMRAAYGTAAIPIGDNATAVVSVSDGRFSYPHR